MGGRVRPGHAANPPEGCPGRGPSRRAIGARTVCSFRAPAPSGAGLAGARPGHSPRRRRPRPADDHYPGARRRARIVPRHLPVATPTHPAAAQASRLQAGPRRDVGGPARDTARARRRRELPCGHECPRRRELASCRYRAWPHGPPRRHPPGVSPARTSTTARLTVLLGPADPAFIHRRIQARGDRCRTGTERTPIDERAARGR